MNNKDEIIKLAKSINEDWWLDDIDLQTFAKLVAEKEREACAEICDGFYLSWIDIQGRYEFMGEGASECAGAIRTKRQV